MPQSKKQIRNLAQYKHLSDDEFESLYSEREKSKSNELDERVAKKIEEFGQDYDIDDLKINDKESLKALVRALLALEDYEQEVYDIRSNGVNSANITVLNGLQKNMSDLRKDISKLQEDLNISRRIRKSDKESSVISYIANLKEQARKFYESRSSFVFCPKCNMLLATVWVLYPEEDNKFSFKCHRVMEDGSHCNEKVVVTSKELLESRGTNAPEITPEGLL